MGNGAYGQCGHRGQWGTGVWGTWAIGIQEPMEYRGMGHMDNEAHRRYGVQGYEPHGQ